MEDSCGCRDAARDFNGLSEIDGDEPIPELDGFRWCWWCCCCLSKAVAAFGGEGVERLICLLRFELVEGELPPSPVAFWEFQLTPKPLALDPSTCTLSGLFLLGDGPGDANGVVSSPTGENGDRSTSSESTAAKRLANEGGLG